MKWMRIVFLSILSIAATTATYNFGRVVVTNSKPLQHALKVISQRPDVQIPSGRSGPDVKSPETPLKGIPADEAVSTAANATDPAVTSRPCTGNDEHESQCGNDWDEDDVTLTVASTTVPPTDTPLPKPTPTMVQPTPTP